MLPQGRCRYICEQSRRTNNAHLTTILQHSKHSLQWQLVEIQHPLDRVFVVSWASKILSHVVYTFNSGSIHLVLVWFENQIRWIWNYRMESIKEKPIKIIMTDSHFIFKEFLFEQGIFQDDVWSNRYCLVKGKCTNLR